MTCVTCGREIANTANFCRYCGSTQGELTQDWEEIPETATPGDASPAEPPQQLQAAVTALQIQVGRLAQRVATIESVLLAWDQAATTSPPPRQAEPSPVETGPSNISTSAPAPSTPLTIPPTPPTSPVPTAAPASPLVSNVPPAPGDSGGALSGGQPPRDSLATGGAWNWEWLVGGNWLARIGILALVIGIGFFLKLAFDNEWIGETGRVILGLVAGLALLGAGEFWSRKYAVWSQAVTGGGLAILYLSVFAAFSLYELIPAWTALGFTFLVTVTAAGLSLRYEARAIAVLGILGGFATPLFLADKLPEQWVLLGYVLVLDAGVLALATFRNWRWFTLLALVGSIILFLFWNEELDPDLALSQLGITVVFLIFVGATTLFHLIWRRPPQAFDQVLITLNAAAYLGISYGQLWDDFRIWMGGFTLLLAVFYGLLAYGILMRHREQVNLSMFAVGVALVLLSIAVPVQLEGFWIGPAWAVEGTVLVWLSFFIRMPQLRLFGVAAFAVALGWQMIGEVSYQLGVYYFFSDYHDSGWLALNLRLLSHAIIIAATYLAAFFWWRGREGNVYQGETYAPAAFLVAANVITLWALSVQVVDAVNIAVEQFDTPHYIVSNIISLSLSALWAVYAAVLIVLGIVRQLRWLRLGGLALLAVPILKLFFYDAFQLDQGYRVAAFIGLGALLVLGGFLYQRYNRVIRGFFLE